MQKTVLQSNEICCRLVVLKLEINLTLVKKKNHAMNNNVFYYHYNTFYVINRSLYIYIYDFFICRSCKSCHFIIIL